MSYEITEQQKEMSLDWKQNTSPIYKELHSLCSYLAMFPPYVPNYYINKYTNEGDLVYEPFSGRGTTTLEAKRLKRRTISNDLSPLAYVLTRAKADNMTKAEIIKRVDIHQERFKSWIKDKEKELQDSIHDEMKVFYSLNNLRQMYYIREVIGRNFKTLSKIDNYILSISMGIMHGKTKVNGDSSYFSVSMPNGYSMSPNYAKKFIKEKKLELIETNIFEQIKNRIEIKNPISEGKAKDHKVNFGNALNSSKFVKETPKLIFTSPPYLNIVKYVSQNWIRFWLLGFSKKQTNEKIVDDYHNLEMYKNFMIEFMNEMKKIMDENTKLIMVIGDVNKISIRSVMEEILPETGLKLHKEPEGQILKRKLSNSMGKKAGKATPTDWVFILEKINEKKWFIK